MEDEMLRLLHHAGGGKLVKWSARTWWDLAPTAWARRLAELRAEETRLWDLTASNPTHCGFHYDPGSILGPLADPASLEYDPDPRGLLTARQAVCRYYQDHGATVDPRQITLTTSTSEAYSFLFRLLCDAGDEVLIGQPGYPLFDFLARLDDVKLVPYQMFYDHGWHLDPAALRAKVNDRTRAIVVVHPNNPTGHFTRPEERRALEAICLEHQLALIVDEVFLDYAHAGQPAARSFTGGEHPVPTFVLSGLSKIAALPQMKAAWIAAFCDPEALERLEVVADTYLSVSTPIQRALPHWLAHRDGLQAQIRDRVDENLRVLDTALARQPLLSRLGVEAGWYAVLRVPELQTGETLALWLLEEQRVVVHTGNFFGFAGEGWLVVSLLTEEEEFAQGIAGILRAFERRAS
jgi:alanine-synthesizing transaminase